MRLFKRNGKAGRLSASDLTELQQRVRTIRDGVGGEQKPLADLFAMIGEDDLMRTSPPRSAPQPSPEDQDEGEHS